MSNNAIIDQIIANADIVKIIGKHVELKRSGNEFKGCCPFHGEKTPSFFVNPQKGLYNCFGCGVAGNALTFLKEYENLTAGEALRELSRQTGIELPKEPINKSHTYQRTSQPKQFIHNTATQKALQADETTSQDDVLVENGLNDLQVYNSLAIQPLLLSENQQVHNINELHLYSNVSYADSDVANLNLDDGMSMFEPSTKTDWYDVYQVDQQIDGSSSLYDLLAQICLFYQHQLAKNTTAKNYFLNRGLSEQTITEFALGYAPSGWQHLEQAFPQDIEGLKILGLVRASQKGKEFDLLRNRVIFPIRDNQGRIVGFAGRALSDDEQPKYINSSDSPVFHKQSILYGLYEGRKAKAKDWLVVEGYMDVISLHQAGVYGAVASMGTAIAQTQIEKLLQLNPTLTLSFDGDSAGQKAAWRAMEVGLPALTDGKELRFLTLPDNHDPDSYVKAHGVIAMQQQISQAIPLSQYLFSSLTRQFPANTAENRSKILQEVYQLTQKLPKGSFGWLLRDDIKSRMGLGRRYQSRQAQDALLNFKTQLTPQLHLQLCFLYQPELLGTLENDSINQRLVDDIYSQSKAFKVFFPNKKPRNNKKNTDSSENHRAFANIMFFKRNTHELRWQIPKRDNQNNLDIAHNLLNDFYKDKCLKWQDIADENLLRLVTWIQHIQPQLTQFEDMIDNEYDCINAKAHFILAGLPIEQQRILMQHWINFFNGLSQRLVTDISVLVTEVLLQLMLESLQKQQKTLRSDLANLTICRKHLQAIITWQRQWLQTRDEKQ